MISSSVPTYSAALHILFSCPPPQYNLGLHWKRFNNYISSFIFIFYRRSIAVYHVVARRQCMYVQILSEIKTNRNVFFIIIFLVRNRIFSVEFDRCALKNVRKPKQQIGTQTHHVYNILYYYMHNTTLQYIQLIIIVIFSCVLTFFNCFFTRKCIIVMLFLQNLNQL